MATEPGSGLAGVVAGHTAVATVGKEGKGLTYRGYSINDLAEHASFEEVAYLLIYGRLPKQADLDEYKTKLRTLRALPLPLKTVLELIPRSTHPMDVMRTGCSMLGTLEPEGAGHDQIAVANRLVQIDAININRKRSFTGTHHIDVPIADRRILHGEKARLAWSAVKAIFAKVVHRHAGCRIDPDAFAIGRRDEHINGRIDANNYRVAGGR